MSKSWKAPDRPGSGTIPGEKAFGVALKPVGRNLTLDRGGNSSVTASKNAKTEKPESVAQIAKLKHVSKEQISPRSGSGRPSQTPAITCTKSKLKSASKSGSLDSGDFGSKSNSIKVGGFSLTKAEDASRGSVKNRTESAEMSSPLKTPFHKSLTTRKNPASKFDPISGEITLDSTKVDKFMAEVKKSEKKTEERPWNVKLRSVETAETAVKRVTTAKQWKTSSTKNSELSLDLSTLVEKDNSRRPRLDGRAKSVPNYETKIFSLQGDQGKQSVQKSNKTKSKSEKEISTVTIKGDKQDVTGSKKGENGTKPVICSPKPVKASKKPAKQATKTFENDSNKERAVSPRGAFVLKLIEKCETRDEHKDSTHGNDVSPVKTPQFPNSLLEKLAVLEGLVSGSSSDDSDVSDEDGGYADVAAVIECLAEEDIDKRKRRFAFKDKKNGKTEKAFIDRRSAPPLSPKHSEKEEENVYNSPEECPSVPDWDTGSSRMSMAESESTSSDSVMNNVNIQPHTVIELSDKQARKLKKRQPDSSSSAKWKKKWKQFYRRSQDLLDIPGLQTKLENLSLGQLPANVKQKLRDRMKKKKGRKSGHFEVNPVVDEDDFDEDFRVSSSEDLPSDAGEEDIYQSIDLIRNEKVPIVNVNIRMSSSPEKIPISPPVELDQTDSAPDLPPRSNTGSVYEKYSQLGPKVQPDTPPSLPKKSPKSKLSAKRGSLPGHVMLSSSLDEEAPPLPPRNSRLSLGNLDTRVPPQLSASPLAESYLRQPRLAEKFPSEDSPKPLKRDSLLLGKVPPPLHRPAGAVSSSPPKFGLGYLDMNQGEGSSSHESSPERSIDRSVPAPFSNVMDFKQRTVNRKPSLEEVDIDLELQVSVTRSRYKSRFEREPLYQYYDKDYINRQSWQRAISEDPSSEEKEDLDDCPTQECITPEISITISAESRPDDVTSTGSNITTLNQSKTSQRSLWSQVPEVISSGLLDTLTAEQKKEQEAMFEIITSEASYFKSLNVLINTFVMSPELCGDITERSVISKQSKHLLFSNIGAVRDTTEKFLSDLEARWNEGVLISDISDIIIKHATENFDAYTKYCTNKTYQDRTFNSLSKSNPAFKEAVVRLQSNPDVQGLSMDSFFLLPMQRITRLPLLMDGVCRHREPGTDKHKLASQALDALSKLVKKCNEGAKVLEQTEQLWMIENQLDFKIKKVPIVSSSRHLVKEGELVRVVTDSSSKLPFGKNKPGKQNIYIFLFNDLLLVTKRKGENLFSVIDYTKRNSVHCEQISSTESCPLLPNGAPSGCKNLFLMAMLENHEGKQVEMVLACNSPSDRARWMEAVTPVQQVSDSEKIYEEWDCPQVQAIHRYTATQPDELDLEEADVVNVFRKMADGWFEGERIRDGERGWFPESYVEEILSSHVRARNLRIRYRLLVASKDFALRKS